VRLIDYVQGALARRSGEAAVPKINSPDLNGESIRDCIRDLTPWLIRVASRISNYSRLIHEGRAEYTPGLLKRDCFALFIRSIQRATRKGEARRTRGKEIAF